MSEGQKATTATTNHFQQSQISEVSLFSHLEQDHLEIRLGGYDEVGTMGISSFPFGHFHSLLFPPFLPAVLFFHLWKAGS